jgi:hypothetical protein
MRSHVPVGCPMIAVIQGAAGRQPHAGHMKTRDGKRVLPVADPQKRPANRVSSTRGRMTSPISASRGASWYGAITRTEEQSPGAAAGARALPGRHLLAPGRRTGAKPDLHPLARLGPDHSVVPDTELRHHAQPRRRTLQAAPLHRRLCRLLHAPPGQRRGPVFRRRGISAVLLGDVGASRAGGSYHHSTNPPRRRAANPEI